MKRPISKDRRWCLSWWGNGGWSIGRPNMKGIKKWDQHISALVKDGLLEADEYGMYRITDAGTSVLRDA